MRAFAIQIDPVLECFLSVFGGFELRLAACASPAWRDVAQSSPRWLLFVVDSERKLRLACGRRDGGAAAGDVRADRSERWDAGDAQSRFQRNRQQCCR